MAILSEIIRFALSSSPSSLAHFRNLRNQVRDAGMVKIQYFGYADSDSAPETAEICWYIEWPDVSKYRNSPGFINAFQDIADEHPRSLLLRFWQKTDGEILKALESPFCEMAFIHLPPNAPRFDPGFEYSMHKTFTDCYLAPGGGITGGGWAYALNSNDPPGEEVQTIDPAEATLNEQDKMLAYYIIGWNKKEDHAAFYETELFHEEIDKLTPYYGPGTGNYWVKFEKVD